MGVFTMPSLGADMEAGTLVEWLKAPGDEVQHGDIIAVVETDKGAIEVEVFESGAIEELMVEPGSKVPVGSALARINGTTNADHQTTSATAAKLEPTIEKPVKQVAPASIPPVNASLRASPAARRRAEELAIDLDEVRGSGPGGAIQLEDIEGTATSQRKESKVDLAPMRRAIAAAMARSKREIPHYYLTHCFDISKALEWLNRYNAEKPPPSRILLGALLVKAMASAVPDFPEFNGHYEAEGFIPSSDVHIGNAIMIRGGGLAAPALRNVDKRSLSELMVDLRDLVARTRRGQFRSSEVGDATITISSLGERGVDSVFPIIYPPQVAIVGFGSIKQLPWAVNDMLAIRPVMKATLAGDHRANDGHRGALFLRRIAKALNHPEDL